MKLSVVTVCRNARDTIAAAVESIHRQTYPDVEHIVVDGASTDGTLEALDRYRSGIARLISEPDHGLYFAMNKGIAAATGDYLGFLNSDDIYQDERVLERIAGALRSGAWDSAHGDLVYVGANDPDRIVRFWKSKPYVPGMFEAGWHPAHPTLFVRTAILKELGGFDTTYRFHADFHLMVRLFIERRISSVYVPEILVRMRVGGHTNRSLLNVARGNLESYRIARAYGVAGSPWWVVRKLAFRVGQFFRHPPGA
ncbi:MAG TPA: glycosyltransferase family 2 protein [Burkholderiales bacterium]|jgi:glycosyltransferase involved in cell wall biosynthesis|nr:glycosyltransferase family 2 protein [Burkholderiales bacterium]